MDASLRAAIIYLVGEWPMRVPLTRSFFVSVLYIIDRRANRLFKITWDTSQYYPQTKELVDELDDLGCLRTLHTVYERNPGLKQEALKMLPLTYKDVLDRYLVEMGTFHDLMDTFKIKSEMIKLLSTPQ
jgi:hypothetical protein